MFKDIYFIAHYTVFEFTIDSIPIDISKL